MGQCDIFEYEPVFIGKMVQYCLKVALFAEKRKNKFLMQELLETLEVMHDKELVKDMRASLREAKQCKTMTLEKLVRDLHLDTKVLCGKTAHGEFQGVYSYRVGKYRILYRIEEERILLLAVGHRKSMYK